MTKRDFGIYLNDILKNMQIAEDFLSKITFEKFAKDTKTAYAVIRCLEIIGEAAKHIPNGVKNEYPEVPWKAMAGMRDKLAHQYFGIVLKVVWKAVKEEIPKNRLIIVEILKDLENKG